MLETLRREPFSVSWPQKEFAAAETNSEKHTRRRSKGVLK